MRILLPTGAQTAAIVRDAARGYDAEVVVTGEVASLLTPRDLAILVGSGCYDLVIVSGMSTASFEEVEEATGVPVFRGPRHAADLGSVLAMLGRVPLSRTVPADDFLAARKHDEALREIARLEDAAGADFCVRGVKIGGGSRIKVLAEVMDAHRRPDLAAVVGRYFAEGADIVDLGFGFDAGPADVIRCFAELDGIGRPLAIDSQDPALIRAALSRADIVLSLHEENIPAVGRLIADCGAAAVVVPKGRTLAENLATAEGYGISRLVADPLLMPVGSGFADALRRFGSGRHPLFFGAGNVVELIDADSPGANALLAGLAHELGAAVIFTSEHSDKTQGSIAEMRRACEMMALMRDRPYPKDLGLDLLILKEKRKRREPPLRYDSIEDASPAPDQIVYDPRGNFRIGIEGSSIVAVIHGRAVRGRSWADVFSTILSSGDVSLLDHAAYLGKELYKAELALRFRRSFEQDGPF